jgi:hypothetical protein
MNMNKRSYTITIEFNAFSDEYAEEIKEKITSLLWDKFPYSMTGLLEIKWEDETWADMTLRKIEKRKEQASKDALS